MTVDRNTGEIVEALTEQEAERLTTRIALKLDAMADTYAGVMPMIREAIDREAWRALGYRSVGEYVSDRFGGVLGKLGIEIRREVVKELTAAGMSTRAIAPVVGASHMTVQNDREAGVKTFTPATPTITGEEFERLREAGLPTRVPAPVVGIDGKEYTRQRKLAEFDQRSDEQARERLQQRQDDDARTQRFVATARAIHHFALMSTRWMDDYDLADVDDYVREALTPARLNEAHEALERVIAWSTSRTTGLRSSTK